MRTSSLVLLVFCLGVPAGADDVKKEIERLQGQWEVERIESDGKIIPLEKVKDKQYTLKGDELIPSQNPKDPGKLELSPGKKPAGLDLTDKDNKTMLGIYRVDGDRWEIHLSDPGSARPTEFNTAEGGKSHIMVLRRKGK